MHTKCIKHNVKFNDFKQYPLLLFIHDIDVRNWIYNLIETKGRNALITWYKQSFNLYHAFINNERALQLFLIERPYLYHSYIW